MDVYEDLIRERSEGRACAMATIVAFKGSIPSHENAKMVVHEDGSIVGTVGGGPAEAEVILAAREEGHTWRQIAAAAGLTELATCNAAKRAATAASDGESPVS